MTNQLLTVEISSFTPTQVLMLTNPVQSVGKDLFKYSLIDLIFKDVLTIKKEWRYPDRLANKKRLYTFISKGKQYQEHKLPFHQQPFAKPFKKRDFEYQLPILMRKILKELEEDVYQFKLKIVYPELQRQGYFKTSLGLKHLGLFFLNKKGSALKTKFQKQLDQADNQLSNFSNLGMDQMFDLIHQLGSNILLLESFNDELIKQLKSLFKEMTPENQLIPNSRASYTSKLFLSFIDTMEAFDVSLDAFEVIFRFPGGNEDAEYFMYFN